MALTGGGCGGAARAEGLRSVWVGSTGPGEAGAHAGARHRSGVGSGWAAQRGKCIARVWWRRVVAKARRQSDGRANRKDFVILGSGLKPPCNVYGSSGRGFVDLLE
eukprot:scaffold36672_cov40-Phaeocystis_antarctica.AAC.2